MKFPCLRRVGPRVAGAAVLALSLAGCGHDHDHEHDHSHGEDASRTVQVLAWGERHEVFAEHRLLVAATPTRFVTHVTDLTTSEPVSAGGLRYEMRLGEEAGLEVRSERPSRPGIYESTLTFPKAGIWEVRVVVSTEGGEQAVRLPPVRVYGTEHDAAHAEVGSAPEGIAFLKEQQWKVGMRVEPVGRRRVVERMRMPARVRARPGGRASAVAPVAGQLAAVPGAGMLMPGERVEEGRVVAWLRPHFSEGTALLTRAQAELAESRAEVVAAEAAQARTEKLVGEQAKSRRELEEAELALRSARARQAAAAGLLSTFHPVGGGVGLQLEVRAPISGVLQMPVAGVGEVVAAGQVLFTVLDADRVWVEARVPEANVPEFRPGGGAAVEVPSVPDRWIPVTGEGGGRLIGMGMEVEAGTRTVPLVYEVPNGEGRLLVGQSVVLHLETARAEEAVVVPRAALVEEGGWYVAYVQAGGEVFEKRELRLGIRDGDWVQVLSGVVEGERVVTRGAQAVRLAGAAGVIPEHGHTH